MRILSLGTILAVALAIFIVVGAIVAIMIVIRSKRSGSPGPQSPRAGDRRPPRG